MTSEHIMYMRPLSEWSDDEGPVLWWVVPISEPPFCGTPLDSDWPGYQTHWTPLPHVIQPGDSHISPNGAEPGSFVYAAEVRWLKQGFTKIPKKGTHAYQAMCDEHSDQCG